MTAETNQTTGGLDRITLKRWRLPVLVAGSLAGVLIVASLEINAWRRLGSVESQLEDFRPETFQLGNELRTEVMLMNANLLRFELSNNALEREAFQKRARDLKEVIGRVRPFLRTAEERSLTERAQTLFDSYLAEATRLLEKGLVGVRRGSAAQVQEEIDRASAELLQISDKLADAQRRSFDATVTALAANTAAVQRSVALSGPLLIVVIGAISGAIYLLMVSPLRTRLSETQGAIQQQERLASLGTLATGVAHEIRNPLTAIKFRLFSLRKSLSAAAQVDNEDIEVINKEINRLERLVKDFLQFARPTEPQRIEVPAQRVMQDVQGLLGPQTERNNIQLRIEEADGIWLKADRQQIEQVLINLVQNAAESIGRDGSITLRARHGISKINRRSAPVVILEVSDTGKGIPGDTEARIFDPFFSTKEAGTGLGLSIAARIVEMHGGYIQYQSDRDRGTTFSIVLPRTSNNGSANPDH
ncbi:MAG: ATP-binding protein [Verrucomicrobia subdivision 3 bacterium]|nr:ATP-binding protein [Limisphaerales bacterium]